MNLQDQQDALELSRQYKNSPNISNRGCIAGVSHIINFILHEQLLKICLCICQA